MDVPALMTEISAALETITGLRVYPFHADSVHPPAAMVALPESCNFDTTYGRGSDMIVVPVWMFYSRVSASHATPNFAEYLSGSGSRSIKAAIEAYSFTEADDVRAASFIFEIVNVGLVDYLAARFTLNCVGSGS